MSYVVIVIICIHPRTVLVPPPFSATQERLKCILVINKIDRLLTELRLSPAECYMHMTRIIEQVNAIASGLLLGEAMAQAAASDGVDASSTSSSASVPASSASGTASVSSASASTSSASASSSDAADANKYQFEIDDREESEMQFAPEKGNVLFASAFDCWAFSLVEFSAFYAKKLGMSAKALQRCLWGEYYYHPKTQVRDED